MSKTRLMTAATMGVAGLSAVIGQSMVMLISSVLMIFGCYYLWRRFVWKAFVPPEPVIAPVSVTT